MNKKLVTTNQNSKLALSKAKKMISVTNRILDKQFEKVIIKDNDDWIQRLLDWADLNNISDLKWIKDNNMGMGGFVGLPRNIDELLLLTELDLSENELTEIPREICNLVNLKYLNLTNNQLNQLPDEINKLVNLNALHLGGNKFTELSENICNIIELKELTLGINQLKKLPHNIYNLVNLRYFTLWSNKNLNLTMEQISWLKQLESNGCYIELDKELSEYKRNINTIDIDNDDIPF